MPPSFWKWGVLLGCQSWVYTTAAPAWLARSISPFTTGTTCSPPRTYRLPPGSAKSFWTATTTSAVCGSYCAICRRPAYRPCIRHRMQRRTFVQLPNHARRPPLAKQSLQTGYLAGALECHPKRYRPGGHARGGGDGRPRACQERSILIGTVTRLGASVGPIRSSPWYA